MERGLERKKEPETTVRAPPGEILPGTRYRLLAKVGQGAMGVVYAAEHVELEKRVALKLLLGGVAARRPDAIERFRQEARAASRIGNPYICDVTDFGQLPDGRVFFVMEYLEGRSLRRILDLDRALEPARAIAILRQVCKALGAAHEKAIVHLDVKPDNVMVLERGGRADAVKVVDFGIAELLRQHHIRERAVNGTPAYIAPERAMGRGYDHRSDIYALGVLAYEALTGGVPFDDGDSAGVLKAHITETPMPLRQRAPERQIPADLEQLVLQMLEKDPDARPQSMAVVEAMLCEAQIAAGLTTTWDDLELPAVDADWRKKLASRMPSPGSRRRKIVVATAVGAALLASAVAVYFGSTHREVQVKVAVTDTEEAPEVAKLLNQAYAAAMARKYTTPGEDSALYLLQRAEEEAARTRSRTSAGVAVLRGRIATSIEETGNELAKAQLPELAATKFQEAALFARADRATAARSPAPTKGEARVERAAKAPSVDDRVKTAAADLFLLARAGRYSEARAAVPKVTDPQAQPTHAAKLADAVRDLASAAWAARKVDEARSLYGLLSDLDPKDRQALERATGTEPIGEAPRDEPPQAAPGPPPASPVAAAPPPVVPAAASARETTRSHAEVAPPSGSRDIGGAKQAARIGQELLRRGRLREAETAFTRAVRADPMNAPGVGGLAEVAFERARYTEALDYGRRAVKLAPKSPRYHLVLGDAYFKLLRYREALAIYEKAQTLAAPADPQLEARIERAKARLR